MFHGAAAFQGNVSDWDVSRVTHMGDPYDGWGNAGMFSQAVAFNSDLSRWNVGSLRYAHGMFNGATSFQSDLSKWDVGSLQNANVSRRAPPQRLPPLELLAVTFALC